MFIDMHAHAYRFPQRFVCRFCSAEQLIVRWDELGIAKGVVMPIVSPEVYFPQTNEDVLEMAEKYPDRIIPFCNIDPRMIWNCPKSDFSEVLEYYKSMGCKGIGEIMPKMELMDPKMQNLLAYAEKAGLSVTFDGSPSKDMGFGIYDDPGLPQLEMTLMSFPKLIVFGHGPLFWSELAKLETISERGYFVNSEGNFIGKMGEGPIKEEGVVPKLFRKFPNLYGDLSDFTPVHMLRRDPKFGAKFLTEFQDRMFFGTDITSPEMEVTIIPLLNDWLAEGLITKEVYDKISYKNAEKFLGLN